MELQIIAHPDLNDFSMKNLKNYLESNDDLRNKGVSLEIKEPAGAGVTYEATAATLILVAVIGAAGGVVTKLIEIIYDYFKTRKEKKDRGQENLLITLKDGTIITIPPGTSKEDMSNILKAVADKPESVERLLLVSRGD